MHQVISQLLKTFIKCYSGRADN